MNVGNGDVPALVQRGDVSMSSRFRGRVPSTTWRGSGCRPLPRHVRLSRQRVGFLEAEVVGSDGSRGFSGVHGQLHCPIRVLSEQSSVVQSLVA